jgi:hypothetical protein
VFRGSNFWIQFEEARRLPHGFASGIAEAGASPHRLPVILLGKGGQSCDGEAEMSFRERGRFGIE